MQTLFNHFLNAARRIYFHRRQVVEAVDLCRVLRELLPKCIRQIVRWICGLQKTN